MPRCSDRRTVAVLGALGALVIVTGCGGFSVPTEPGATPLPGRTSHIGTSAVERAPGGGTWRVTLLSYNPNVHESSGDPGVPLVAGVTVRILNLGHAPLEARPPSAYAVLELLNETGAPPVPQASGPCGGRFAGTPLRLGPGVAVQGCLPYKYTVDEPPIQFLFGSGARAGHHGWPLPH